MDIDSIAGELRTRGFVVIHDSLPAALLDGLGQRCNDAAASGFAPASVGRDVQRRQDVSIRGDSIRWLDDTALADHSYLLWMEGLRVSLNEQLYLGLFEYESHYAIYGVGSHYEKHLDSLAGQRNRLLSTVVYLNEKWKNSNGGELILYRDAGQKAIDQTVVARILPEPGLMVLFLSEDFPHEVLAANKPRRSIAGWFRGRTPDCTIISAS